MDFDEELKTHEQRRKRYSPPPPSPTQARRSSRLRLLLLLWWWLWLLCDVLLQIHVGAHDAGAERRQRGELRARSRQVKARACLLDMSVTLVWVWCDACMGCVDFNATLACLFGLNVTLACLFGLNVTLA